LDQNKLFINCPIAEILRHYLLYRITISGLPRTGCQGDEGEDGYGK
jgi:hypothetical protein